MFYIGVTDLRWHDYLLNHEVPDLVNFWTPTLWRPNLKPGSRWFFMLKAPVRKIGGFGYVVGYEEHTVEEAWRRYGFGNGVGSREELRERVESFAEARSVRERQSSDPIGCILLTGVTVLPDDQHCTPEDLGTTFKGQIVKFKGVEGDATLPNEVPAPSEEFAVVTDAKPDPSIGPIHLRPEQARFRARVLRAYAGRCAVIGVACGEVLDAAHIQPYVDERSNHVQNGLMLRKDIHALFDAGLLAVADDFTIMVSPVIKDTVYGKLDGRKLRLPRARSDWPSLQAIRLQRQLFRGAYSGSQVARTGPPLIGDDFQAAEILFDVFVFNLLPLRCAIKIHPRGIVFWTYCSYQQRLQISNRCIGIFCDLVV